MYHTKTEKEVFEEFKTGPKGLTTSQVETNFGKYGKNEIKKTHKFQPIKIFLQQFTSFLIYVLLIAAVISFLLGHKIDAIVIMAIVILNSVIGFFQQFRAEKAVQGLKKLLVQKSRVIRDGKYLEIPSKELVPGDIVLYEAGDKINADSRIFEAKNLQTNEAALTGESLPILKTEKALAKEIILAKRTNMLFAGTQIVKGTAKAIIVSTGMQTEFGKIAGELQEIKIQKTPMQKRLDVFSKQLSFIIIGMVLIFFLLGVFRNIDPLETFMVAVTLAVGAIPEGLPAVLAMAFAIASNLMSKQNVIVRRLPAVESLGSVTTICTDKTGTLTKEEMHIQEIFSNNKLFNKKLKNLFLGERKIDVKENENISKLIKTSILCNNSKFEIIDKSLKFFGDPTEISLLATSLDFGFNKKILTEEFPTIEKIEFDGERKMMSVLRKNKRGATLYSKGAIEKILEKSTHELINNKSRVLTPGRKKILLMNSQEMEKKALRVLAFAYKEVRNENKISEDNLIFLGFAGMIDPPRSEVKEAITACKDAGIKIKMITGDAKLTAMAIAQEIGITGNTLTGSELEKINDEELSKIISEIGIFARTTHNQKLRIAKILQANGEVVAMTGDGINDVLALKSADIGIAMGKRGTDVAREVSDLVLIDDNFASIVGGVREGRKTYDNIKKFTKYMLSVNFSTIALVSLLTIFGMPLPILPLQILWKNLITDSFPALTLVFNKGEEVMNSKPRKEKSLLSGIWKFIIFAGLLNFTVELIGYLFGTFNSYDLNLIRTMVLTIGIVFELLFVYTCRSESSLTKIGIFSNKWLNYATLLGLSLHMVLLYTPLANVFGVVPLGLNNWIMVILLGIVGVVVFELKKYFNHKVIK